MYSLGVNKLGATNTHQFNPATFFADGTEGAWYDMSDRSTMFKVDGTTPAVQGQAVGKILDKSGNNNHLVQTVLSKCPVLRVDDLGNTCLDFVADDGMQTASDVLFGNASTTAMSVFIAGRKETTGVFQTLVELSNNVGSQNGSFRVFCTDGDEWRSIQKGTSASVITTAQISNPNRAILTSIGNISTPRHLFRQDGVVVNDTSGTLGTGTYLNQPLNLGARANGAASQLDGKIYTLVVVGKEATEQQIFDMEQYMSDKSGVSI